MKPSVLLILAVLALGSAPPTPAQSTPESATATVDVGVPLGQLLESVAKRSGKKFLTDPRVTLFVPVHLYGQEVSKVDYAELLAILNLHGFTAVEEGGYVHVIPNAEARQWGIPTVTGSENLPLAQYVTTLIRVKSVAATQLVPLMRSLVVQQGHLAAVPCRNTLILVDTLANVRRIKALVESLDTGEPLPVERCERGPPAPPSPPPPRPEGPREPAR